MRPEPETIDIVQTLPPPAAAAESAHDVAHHKWSLPGMLRKLLLTVAGLFCFVLALQLLKEGAATYGHTVLAFLTVSSSTGALGFGWLLAYVFLSGSPVAAIAVTLFAAETITALQTFTMITGSRLGASFVILCVGLLYYLRGHRHSAGVAIGVLALLTTAAIYLPALAIGYWLLTSERFAVLQIGTVTPMSSFIDALYGPIIAGIERLGLPGWVIFLGGIGVLLLAFGLLDRALPEMHGERGAFKRVGRLVYRPLSMFILGALVTSVTLSVSVSLGLLVPLAARGVVRREKTVPYIMGANITTFIDTLVAALIVGGPAAFMIVLVEMVSVAVLSLLVLLLCYRRFERAILRIQERILHDKRAFAVFVGIVLVIPVVLLLCG